MDWTAILGAVWRVMNSPAGITFMAAVLVWLLNKLYAKKPAWKQFEGAVISAIKYAEKAIPDATENNSAAKLDAALKYVVTIYEARTGKAATPAVEVDLLEGIAIKHAELEAGGNLVKKDVA